MTEEESPPRDPAPGADDATLCWATTSREVFSQSPGFTTVMSGPDHRVDFVNDSHRALFGSGDWVGKPIREAFPQVAGQGFFELLDKVYTSGQPYKGVRVPARFRPAGGQVEEVRVLDFVYAPFFNSSGSVVGVFCQGIDVTQQVQAERELQDREEQLRLAVEAGDIGLWDVDLDTDGLFWPARVKAMFGISPDVPVTMDDFYAGLHIEDRERVTTAFAAAADPSRRAVYDVEYRTVGKEDRQIRWVAAKGRGVFDAQGKCVRVLGSALDITRRKEAEERILRQQQSFYDLVERAPWGVYVVDENLRITSMNRGSQNGAFANVRPLISTPLEDALRVLWPESVASEITAHFRRTLETGDSYQSREFERPRNDIASLESYEWELHRIRLPDDRYGVVCYYYDSTELRRVERALRVSERRKDEFLATLGHELRNPLAPIGNAAALLQRPGISAERISHYAQMIHRQTRAMRVMLDDLLEVSRITTGKLQLRKATVSVASLVESALEPIRPGLERKGQGLRVEMDGGEALIEADPVRMSQVLTNLLANAVKYTNGNGSILLRTVATPSEVRFEVQDTGIGLTPEQLATVFEMFAQVAPAIERAEGGLGIGLAVAKALVEMHGGTVHATSPGIGQGSSFIVAIPRGAVVVPALVTAEERFEPQRSNQEPVLVADDNGDAAETLAAVLELQGYTVHVAGDGEEALEVAMRITPVACFVDIGMPKMNGYEFARELRRRHSGTAPLLVATTGWGQAEDRRRAIEAGFDVHMVKPIDLNEATRMLAARLSPNT